MRKHFKTPTNAFKRVISKFLLFPKLLNVQTDRFRGQGRTII